MEIWNRKLVTVLLIATAGWLVRGIDGKCALTPLREDRTIAYVCVNGNLNDVEEIPSEAEWIEFTVSRINYLPPDAFSRFKNLRRLTFYNCDLRRISDDAFRGLERLEWLVMSNTRIEVARRGQFRYLTNLRRLTLDGAGLVYVEPDAFSTLAKLETLSLRNNDLDCLSYNDLAPLRDLKTIQIGANPWLCECRHNLAKYFEKRRIEHGPGDEDCVARNVHQGRSVSGFTRKTAYDCMMTLEYPELPMIGRMFNTTTSHRQGRFEWREIVGTGVGSFDRLPDEISWLQIFDVPIPVLRRYTFFRFGNTLRSIEMTNCGVEIVEEEAFAGLHKLERLSLVGNRFTTVGPLWFSDLAKLTDLVLRNNAINDFHSNSLVMLTSLKRLDLSGNRLRRISEDWLRGLWALERIETTGNPLLCDAKDEIERYFVEHNIGYEINSGRCENPGMDSYRSYMSHNQTTWSRSESGTIRWSWAYEVHRPDTPIMNPRPPAFVPPRMTTTTSTPRPMARPGGCQMVKPLPGLQNRDGTIESCICTRASLVDLDRLPDTLDTIVYSGSVIPTIHNDAFRKFGRYLKRLELRECGVQVIDRRAFYNLHVLETLVIRGNDLDVVESEWFEDLRNLRKLDISRNGITRISNGVFERVPYLVSLDLSNNRLNCLGIEHLESLRYLRQLEIEGNPWTCLCITRLVHLMKERRITCNCNPDALLRTNEGGWGCNEGIYTYPTVGYPTAPTTTTTTSPEPTMGPAPPSPYPPDLTPPPGWEPSGSCYSSDDVARGTRGHSYHCSNGDISMLLKIPSHVTTIEIVDSYVPRLTPMAFARFENLTELVLRNCTLRDIDVRAFAGLWRLEKLTLRNNRFTTVKDGWFRETRNLVWLDMSDNYLTEIETGAFDGLERLEYLNLEGNNFQCIYTSCIVGLPRLASLEFGRNPLKWRCWQELRQFLEIRAIGYTNHVCPHNGKDLVRNLLKDDKPPTSSGVDLVHSKALVILFATLVSLRLCAL